MRKKSVCGWSAAGLGLVLLFSAGCGSGLRVRGHRVASVVVMYEAFLVTEPGKQVGIPLPLNGTPVVDPRVYDGMTVFFRYTDASGEHRFWCRVGDLGQFSYEINSPAFPAMRAEARKHAGDVDGDGTVGMADLALTKLHRGLPFVPQLARYDVHVDGVLDDQDVARVKERLDFGSSPEPE